MLAALTLIKSVPFREEIPSCSSNVRKGFGGSSPGILMARAALAVPHGGAKNTPLTAGWRTQFSTACCSSHLVKSTGMILTSEPEDLVFSTAIEFEKPCLLKHAVTPPEPANNSKMIESASVKLCNASSSQSAPDLGISSLCATQIWWFLKQFALKHTCRPLLHAPPAGAWSHCDKLKLKHNARPLPSRPTLDSPRS